MKFQIPVGYKVVFHVMMNGINQAIVDHEQRIIALPEETFYAFHLYFGIDDDTINKCFEHAREKIFSSIDNKDTTYKGLFDYYYTLGRLSFINNFNVKETPHMTKIATEVMVGMRKMGAKVSISNNKISYKL